MNLSFCSWHRQKKTVFLCFAIGLLQSGFGWASCPIDVQKIRDFTSSVVLAGEPSDKIHIIHLKNTFNENDEFIHSFDGQPVPIQMLCLEEAFGQNLPGPALGMGILAKKGSIKNFHDWDRLPDETYEEISKGTEQVLAQIKIGTLPSVQSLADPKEGIDLSDSPEFLRDFFSAIVKRYFDEIPSSMRREVIAAFIKLPPNADKNTQLKAVVNHAGPALQKLFQLIAKKSKSDNMKGILEELESGIDPMTSAEVDEALMSAYKSKHQMKKIYSLFDRKPIAAATIGQVHFATLRGAKIGKGRWTEGEKVVVKIQRRNLTKKVEAELRTLHSIAPSQQAKSMIEKIEPVLEEELDFVREAASLDRGGAIYDDPNSHISVVHRITALEKRKDILVMERARGKSFDHLGWDPATSCAKAKSLSVLLEKWFREAIFSSGFFHGDLHGGNLFLDVNQLAPELSNLTLIDFGNSFQLNREQQENILKFILGVQFKSARLILTGMLGEKPESSSGFSAENERAFSKFLSDLSSKNLGILKESQEIIDHITNMGIDLHREFLAYNRGVAFVEQQLDEAIQHLGSKECSGVLAPEKIYTRVIMQGLKLDTWGNILKSIFQKVNCCKRKSAPKKGAYLDLDIAKEIFSSCVKSTVENVSETLECIGG